MALKIRLQRQGTKNAPVFRIVVIESSKPARGACVEQLGHYNPRARKLDPKIKVNIERFNYWKSVGAQASDTVCGLIRQIASVQPQDGICILLPEQAISA